MGRYNFSPYFIEEETKRKSNFIESDTMPDNLLSSVMFLSKNAFSYSNIYNLSSAMLALLSKMFSIRLIEYKVKDSKRFQ